MAARRLHAHIYATIALCCLTIVVCSVALGTDEWFRSEAVSESLQIKVKYGLFKGVKTKTGTGSNPDYDLKVVCQSSKCMFSCGYTSELRKQDLEAILSGEGLGDSICRLNEDVSNLNLTPNQSEPGADLKFLNLGLLIMTIAFLILAILFAALGGGLALYNTYRTPVQPILSVFGLYIWNGVSAICVLLAMIMWVISFATALNKNAAISDTLNETGYESEGKGSFGISFWILILGVIFPLINIGVLRYRSWKIVQMEAKNVKVMTEKLESGDILLF